MLVDRIEAERRPQLLASVGRARAWTDEMRVRVQALIDADDRPGIVRAIQDYEAGWICP